MWCSYISLHFQVAKVLLIEELLHQLIGSLSHYLPGFIHPRWCRISSINSMQGSLAWLRWNTPWWFQFCHIFSPLPGEMIPFKLIFLKAGWFNHPLEDMIETWHLDTTESDWGQETTLSHLSITIQAGTRVSCRIASSTVAVCFWRNVGFERHAHIINSFGRCNYLHGVQ